MNGAGLLKFPTKFWTEVLRILFTTTTDDKEAGVAHSPKAVFSAFHTLQVMLADDKLNDVVSNFQDGGSVWELAKYYNQCIEVAGSSNLSANQLGSVQVKHVY